MVVEIPGTTNVGIRQVMLGPLVIVIDALCWSGLYMCSSKASIYIPPYFHQPHTLQNSAGPVPCLASSCQAGLNELVFPLLASYCSPLTALHS